MSEKESGEDGPIRERDEQGRWKATELDAVLEVQLVEGAEGERLARQQARVFYDIMEWYAQQQQPPTSDDNTSAET